MVPCEQPMSANNAVKLRYIHTTTPNTMGYPLGLHKDELTVGEEVRADIGSGVRVAVGGRKA